MTRSGAADDATGWGGRSLVRVPCAHDRLLDTPLAPGTYTYEVRCGYRDPDGGLVWSRGVTIDARAERWPSPVEELTVRRYADGGRLTIAWRPPAVGDGVLLPWTAGPVPPGTDVSGLVGAADRIPATSVGAESCAELVPPPDRRRPRHGGEPARRAGRLRTEPCHRTPRAYNGVGGTETGRRPGRGALRVARTGGPRPGGVERRDAGRGAPGATQRAARRAGGDPGLRRGVRAHRGAAATPRRRGHRHGTGPRGPARGTTAASASAAARTSLVAGVVAPVATTAVRGRRGPGVTP